MTEFFSRIFKIYQGEGTKVFQFSLLAAMLQAGLAIGMSAADSLFLINVGPAALPRIYVIMPFMMLIYISIYSYLLSRFQITRVFNMTLLFLVAGGVGIYFLLNLSGANGKAPAVIYYIVKLYSMLWYIGIYTLFWNFADNYFDILDAKRLFSIFTGGASFGAMLGGGLVSVLSGRLQVENMFLAWAGLAFLTFPILNLVSRRWTQIESLKEDEEAQSFVQEIRDTGKFLRKSTYVRLFISVLFAALVLTTLTDFQFSQILAQGRSEEQLAALIGQLFALASAFNLLINFFVFNRMVLTIGVGNVALVQPITYLAAFTYFLFGYGSGSAIFGFFAYHGIMTSIDYNNQNFLFNAVPLEARKQVRTFMEGLCEPLATAATGLFLLIWANKVSPEKISALGLIGACIYLLLSFLLRSSYLKSMISNMKQEWLDFSKPEEAMLKGLDDTHLESLLRVVEGDDQGSALSAIQIIWLNDPEKGLEAMLSFLADAKNINRTVVVPMLSKILREDNSDDMRHVVEWLERQNGPVGSILLEELANASLVQPFEVMHFLDSEFPIERVSAVVALWNSWDTNDRLRAMEVVQKLLEGGIWERRAAICALGRSRQERLVNFMVPYMSDSSGEVRREALMALRRLANGNSARMTPHILRAIEVGDSEERIICMDTLSNIEDADCAIPLLAMSATFTPFEQRQTEKLLVSLGLKVVPAIATALRDTRFPYQARSIAARALGKLAFPQLELFSPALIHTEMERAYHYLYCHQMLGTEVESSKGLHVLSRYYADMPATIVDFVLELLTVGGRLPDFELLSASLRSTNKKERGNAIETIEQGTGRDTFKVLLPLIDGRDSGAKIEFYHTRFAPTMPSKTEIVLAALESTSPLECSAAAQALFDDLTLQSRDETLEILRRKMRETMFPLFRETVLSVFARAQQEAASTSGEAGGRSEQNVPWNGIQKLYYLLNADFFASFTTQDLDIVVRGARQVNFPTGSKIFSAGDTAAELYLVTEGTATTAPDITKGPGEILGEGGILGETLRRAEAISQGMNALMLSATHVETAAKTYPTIAIGLLTRKLKDAHSHANLNGSEAMRMTHDS